VGKWLFALIQFFPLSLFAAYAFWHGAPSDARWVEAFQLGALAAFLQLLVVLPQRRPANRLILAANLYLLVGGGAALFHQWWLLSAYDALKESGIFMFMVAVGLVSTFATPAGFVAVVGPPRDVRSASYWLLAATLLALGVSLIFEGDRTWAAVVPIICLAVLHRLLIHRVRYLKIDGAHNNALERSRGTAG
jgi:hypothetical protein